MDSIRANNGLCKKGKLHEKVFHIALMFAARVPKHDCASSLVELVDFYPTITEIPVLPTPDSLQDKSLLPT